MVYFKGKWVFKFDPSSTYSASFHNRDGGDASIDMMHQRFDAGDIRYYEDDRFKAVRLPYRHAESEQLFMDIILPLDDSLEVLDRWRSEPIEYREGFLRNLRSAGSEYGVNLSLPRFTMKSDFDLTEAFRKMGMGDVLSNRASFDRIILGQTLKVGNGKHQSKIEVDESGTIAAAVTEIVMDGCTCCPEPPRKDFRCDRPFIFVIAGGKSGAGLFVGYVGDF